MPRWCRRRRCRVLDEQPWRDSSPGFANRAVPMYERYPRFEWHWRNACGAKWHRIPGSPIDTGSRWKFPCADHVSSRSSLWQERADRPVKGDSDWRIRPQATTERMNQFLVEVSHAPVSRSLRWNSTPGTGQGLTVFESLTRVVKQLEAGLL